MKKEDILKRSHLEKDEGESFISYRSQLKGYGYIIMIAVTMMFLSFLLTGDIFITDLILVTILPMTWILYLVRYYYLKEKTNLFVGLFWLFINCSMMYKMAIMIMFGE